MSLTIPTHLFKFKPSNHLAHQSKIPSQLQSHVTVITVKTSAISHHYLHPYYKHNGLNFNSNISFCSKTTVLTRASASDNGGEAYAAPPSPPQSSSSPDVDMEKISSSSSGDGYVALFIRMLGLDNDALDREQAIVALWKYSLGGKQYVDNIMQFRGSVNLTVNLLRSESNSACEAAGGLLRMISSVNVYRDAVAESGAIEEITGLLRRSSLSPEVKEQCICTLWNLSVEEKFRFKIANSDLLPLLVKFLEDDSIKVKEAAGGVLANLALSHSNHEIMVEAGVIPKLAKLLTTDAEGSKVMRKEARNALLEIARDEYNKILVMEEGLVLVPLIGTAAYRSFRPALHSWPSLPDGTKIEQSSKGPSRYGASELLLGLHVQEKNANLEEAKMKAIVGRTQQQFLARIGAIELEDGNITNTGSTGSFTLLPWMDGVARLVLILELEDESAIARAADAIADAAISQHMRISIKEAGAVKYLVQLINHPSETVQVAVIRALDRLSISDDICHRIVEEGALYPLIDLLKRSENSQTLTEMILNILTRILDPGKEMKSKFYAGPVNGSSKGGLNATEVAGHVNQISESKSTSSLESIHIGDLLDISFVARLIGILKTSSPDVQRRAASILECITVIEACQKNIISADVDSGLDAVFKQASLNGIKSDVDGQRPELHALELEETGRAISAASRLLTRMLDFEDFRKNIDSQHFTKLLREILMSDIPLQCKDWVAACLVKLSSLLGLTLDFDNPINVEVILYETIPRLIEHIKTSSSHEVQEAAVLELNRIISEGVVDSNRAVAAEGGIFPLVKLIEEGSERAAEAGLAILYNLSMNTENHPAIIAAGAIPVLRRIVLSQRSQWMRALHLLRTLSA